MDEDSGNAPAIQGPSNTEVSQRTDPIEQHEDPMTSSQNESEDDNDQDDQFKDFETRTTADDGTKSNHDSNPKGVTQPEDTWNSEPWITKEEADNTKFYEAEKRYISMENPSMRDSVHYTVARRNEATRRQVLDSRIRNSKEDGEQDEETCAMIRAIEQSQLEEVTNTVPEGPTDALYNVDDGSATTPMGYWSGVSQRKPHALELTPREKARAMEFGLRNMIGVNEIAERLYMTKTTRKQTENTENSPEDTQVKRRKVRTLTPEEVLRARKLAVYKILESARLNGYVLTKPLPKLGDKEKAVAEIVASLPFSDGSETLSKEKVMTKAIRMFDHKPRSNRKNEWNLSGLKSRLYRFQVLGVSWMRERERSQTPPYGGVVCYAMGLGKTITALANMADARPDDKERERQCTLIVVPNDLLPQWKREIPNHCDLNIFGDFHVYCHRTELTEEQFRNSIKRRDIVLTTYTEVQMSYPTQKPPSDKDTPKLITEWWKAEYGKKFGLLHKVHWHRIVIDEGHKIKNEKATTSIAIRALTGTFKWILTGTATPNDLGEVYPYFNFLEEPHSCFREVFCREFFGAQGKDETAKNRLKNMARSIFNRKDPECLDGDSSLARYPKCVVTLVELDICRAERILYDKIADSYLENINESSSAGSKVKQKKCILGMFLHLRMFVSHPLAAPHVLRQILDDKVMHELNSIEQEEGSQDTMSLEICRNLRRIISGEAKAQTHGNVDEVSRSEAKRRRRGYSALRRKLTEQFRQFLYSVCEAGEIDFHEVLKCASCKGVPNHAFVTSCNHLYCEECYGELPKSEEVCERDLRSCPSCQLGILEAAYWGGFDSITGFEKELDRHAEKKKTKKRKRATGKSLKASAIPNAKKQKAEAKKLQRVSESPLRASSPLFVSSDEESEDDSGEDEEDYEDWISIFGSTMPGSKLSKIRELVKGWIQEDPDVKIVVFTEFLETIQLLEYICKAEEWKYVCISGKVAAHIRDKNHQDFQNDISIKILLATTKVGGSGLNLDSANKCILTEFWWNEAVDKQAWSRLLRITQEREVEVVRLAIKDTIDDRILEMQQEKTKNTDAIFHMNVLNDRDTVLKLLEYFGEVQRDDSGKITIVPKKRKRKQDPAKQGEAKKNAQQKNDQKKNAQQKNGQTKNGQLKNAEQNHAEQNHAEQNHAEQNHAEQNHAEQNHAEQKNGQQM